MLQHQKGTFWFLLSDKQVNVVFVIAGILGTKGGANIFRTAEARSLTFEGIDGLLVELCGIIELLLSAPHPGQNSHNTPLIAASSSSFFVDGNIEMIWRDMLCRV